MSIKVDWSVDSRLSQWVLQWWHGLDDERAIRARLRRCTSSTDVALCPDYQKFRAHLIAANLWPVDAQDWQNRKLEAIVGLLVHVKENSEQDLAWAMSETEGDKPKVSELRFRRLLKITEIDDLFQELRRALPLIGHRVDIRKLAEDVYHWGSTYKNVPKQWAYAYRWPAKLTQ